MLIFFVGMSSTIAFAQEPVAAAVEQNAASPEDDSSIFTMEDVHRRFRLMAAANLDEHFLDVLDDDLIFDLMEFPGMHEQDEIPLPSYPMGEAKKHYLPGVPWNKGPYVASMLWFSRLQRMLERVYNDSGVNLEYTVCCFCQNYNLIEICLINNVMIWALFQCLY